MNLLIITLCLLIKTMIITAGIHRLSKTTLRTTTPTTTTTTTPIPYREQYYAQTSTTRTTTPTTPGYSPTTSYYTRLNKSLYNYTYNTDTGIQVQEEGHLKNVGTDQEILEARGSYNYTDNDNNTFEVSYIANENGFQPQGAHLPTVPPLIKKALQYIAEHPGENAE